ncbi:MAG: Eco57I restriction-modification methylase domain-containing protein [Dehalococcoidia bacterium]|nr:Eco57I restriction-modification methylase domain-containing protein [Dehalococcoidia bacterium]
MAGDTEAKVHDILGNLRSLDKARELFSELNYDPAHDLLSRSGWTKASADALAEDPQVIASHDDFKVIYARLNLECLLLGDERPVVNCLLQKHPYSLCLFSDRQQQQWHFVNIKYDEDVKRRRLFRRITVGPDERLRTATERLSKLDLESISADLFGLSPLAIQSRHDEAFDVEAVTKQFFNEYKAVFRLLEDELCRQTKDSFWAHDYALQFLNRCMFLYFIQRKCWLGNDKEFLRSFWKSYQSSGQTSDSFVDKWLKPLFFEAFNNKFHAGHTQFPQEIRDTLQLAPYLNGGLFTENKLDGEYGAEISDTRFNQIFKFLERYNFTIAEDSPLDKEIAVDPEMIGKVYENLVNVSEDADRRGEAGIFYTPRTEIDLMCRLSLVDHLANHLGDERKELLYQLIFALESDEKADADRAVASTGLWPTLNERLHDITVLDPACGSGSFLVGMLNILGDLQERANHQLGIAEAAYERKKRIIGQSLYGVDVMEWACHVAELRLWLALIIDAEFTREELHVRREPLLPYFSFKVRCGDSLVQEVGGIDLGHIRRSHDIPASLKARITKLKTEKLKFYNNDETCQFRSPDQIKQEEKRLFQDVLNSRQHEIQEHIKFLRRKVEGPQERRIRLDGTIEERSHQIELEARQYQRQIEALQGELEQVGKSSAVLKTAVEVPFVWDIAFVEIFESEKDGFDIVIGNPPYVRQESIADPHMPHEEITAENKRIYKAKLAKSVYLAFPQFFGYKVAYDTAAHRINAKSDLYIYFYFHGLSLLNTKGAFCFISSNSWLDVGYGADLQEFLLRHCRVKMILDNQAKRVFSNADVNSIIAVFSAPDDRRDWALDKTARFVMFRVPHEHILSPVIFDEIEEAAERRATKEYRVFPIQQSKLLEDGCEIPQEEETGKAVGPLIKTARYIGNKWGGKYLRAPDIYWTILEKGKGKLVRLGDVAEVRFGIKTGANEFFYLDEARIREWGIEEEFLRPVVKSPRECKRIIIDPRDLKYKIFMCSKDKKELKGTAALGYISWGESQGFHENESVKSRRFWWRSPDDKGNVFWAKEVRERIAAFCSEYPMYADCRLYLANVNKWYQAVLNSTFTAFLSEAMSRNLGGGGGPRSMMVYEVQGLLTIKSDSIDNQTTETVSTLFKRIGSMTLQPFIQDVNEPNRRSLDNVIFDTLGLTQGERDAVYEAVINLVEARLKKADSV